MNVRVATDADAAAIQAIYAPIVTTTAISFELVPPPTKEIARRIRQDLPRHPWVVATEEQIAGYAYAHPFAERGAYAWSVSTSVYVHPARHRQGVGRLIYSTLIRLLEFQGYRRAIAGITLPNPASVALHEAIGFQPTGTYEKVGWKLGSWHDVLMLQRPLGPSSPDPGPPRSVEAIDEAMLRQLLAPPTL